MHIKLFLIAQCIEAHIKLADHAMQWDACVVGVCRRPQLHLKLLYRISRGLCVQLRVLVLRKAARKVCWDLKKALGTKYTALNVSERIRLIVVQSWYLEQWHLKVLYQVYYSDVYVSGQPYTIEPTLVSIWSRPIDLEQHRQSSPHFYRSGAADQSKVSSRGVRSEVASTSVVSMVTWLVSCKGGVHNVRYELWGKSAMREERWVNKQ